MMELNSLLKLLKRKGGSDLHLKVGAPPIMRQAKKLLIMDSKLPTLTTRHIEDIISPILSGVKMEQLKTEGGIDAGITIDESRFRLNVYYQQGLLSVAIRSFPSTVPSLSTLKIPKRMVDLVNHTYNGLILVAGATGSGKSTSIASLIDHINHTQNKHILTMEDPIEYAFKDNRSLITQKELGMDFFDLNLALKTSLRQDPDVIFISELRTRETIELALKAAETGHLVLSTIHTHDSLEVISRIINVFSEKERQSTRMTLSGILKGVMAQQLIRSRETGKLLPIFDIFINNYTLQREIEKGSTKEQIKQLIIQSDISNKWISFNSCLLDYVKKDLLSEEEAIRFSPSPNNIKRILSGVTSSNAVSHTMWSINPNQTKRRAILENDQGEINVKIEDVSKKKLKAN